MKKRVLKILTPKTKGRHRRSRASASKWEKSALKAAR
jgi:hypothetical protein